MKLLVGTIVCCVLAIGARAQWYGGYGYPVSSGPNVTVIYPPQPSPVVVTEYVPARPVTYMIAFKCNQVYLAQQYWVRADTIFFLTLDHEQKAAPLDSVDRVLSQQLNIERNVAFYLPPTPPKVVQLTKIQVKPRPVVHRTAATVRKRCYCTSKTGSAARARVSP
jgi:hypothetical protein